jgi:hypothetical protein
MDIPDIAGWTPFRIGMDDGCTVVDWCDLRCAASEEPFFDQTVARHLSDGRRQIVRTSLQALSALPLPAPPAGFIFHMSRCGSTLLARLLGMLEDVSVTVEASPINAFLGASNLRMEEAELVELLPWLIGRLGRSPHHIVKFSSWNVRRLAVLTKAFPGVPWIFLYRDPPETLASIVENPPQWMRHRSDPQIGALFGAEGDAGVGDAEFAARILSGYCRNVLEHRQSSGRLVNYSQLPEAAWTIVAPWFGLTCGPRDIARMRADAGFYAKERDGVRRFADASRGPSLDSPALRRAAEDLLATPFGELEALRAIAPRP